jgi:hypothetical protein
VLPLLVACNQTKLSNVTHPPVASIESPADGSSFFEGITVTMQGRVVDRDFADQLDSLSAVWSVDSGRVCEDAVVDASGGSTCDYVFTAGDAVGVSVTFTDPSGQSAVANATYQVKPNAAPVATIVEPTNDGVYYSDHQIVFAGTATDTEDASDALTVEWTSSIDGVLDVDSSPTSGGDVSGSALLSEGEHLITMTVTDSTGRTGEDSVPITVSGANAIPECAISSPTTGSFVAAGDTVLFEATATDADVPANTLSATWESDKDGVIGSSTPSSAGSIFFGYDSLSTNTHTITLTVEDDAGAICTDAILLSVGNAPEILLTSPISGDVVNEGDPITFTATVSDAEDSPTRLTMSWDSSIDGVFSTQGANSLGTSSFTYSDLSPGTHTVTVTATDTDGFSALDRATVYVNGLPTAPTVEITPDPAGSGDTITASVVSDSVDPEGDSITYRYEWYRDGVLTTYATSSIAPSIHNRDETWSVRVYPSDGYGEGAYGTDSVLIGNGAPSATSVTISPATAGTNDTLTAVVSGWSDPDGDAESYQYQWYLNGTAISGATDVSLDGSYFVRGDSLVVSATPWDGALTGSTVTSSARVIQNTAPTTPSVSISPENPEDDDDLVCGFTTASTDLDGDSISYTYSWTRNASATSYTSATVPASATSNNDTWICTVTPSDGTASGSSASDTVVVDDYTAPDAPVLDSLAPYRNETTASITGTAEAGSRITLYIVSTTGTTTSATSADASGHFSYSLTGLTRGVSYTYYATATDAEGNTSSDSNTIGTEACDPPDDYEDGTSYGDTCTDPVVDWSILADDGATTITVDGNILDGSDEDWYTIETDDAATSGINYYRFHVEMTHGSSEYRFAVYQGGCAASYLECGSGSSTDPEGSGYTEFEEYAEDQGDGANHSVPADTRQCENGSGYYNNCDDLSDTYYIHVFRTSSAYSCGYYELQISNGIW